MSTQTVQVGDAMLRPEVADGWLRSLGQVEVGGVRLRNPATRFLPWFDSYAGDVFRAFRLRGVSQRGGATVIDTEAVSDPDVMFQERRDSSGDVVLRERSWDAPPGSRRASITDIYRSRHLIRSC